MKQMNIEETYKKQSDYINSFKRLSTDERIYYLKKLKKEIINEENNIYSALYSDLKKPKFETYTAEIGVLLNEIDLFIKNLRSWSQPKRVSSSLVNFPSKDYIIYEPFGMVLIISPWNYPFQLALLPAMSAFSAGNNVVLKPSEHTPKTSALLKKIVNNIFPIELMNVIEGDAKTAEELLEKKWNYIFFTGSVKIGRIVAMTAANNLTPFTLELGGKSPAIIDRNTDIKVTCKRIVWGKLLNSGQTCVAPDYLIVHKSIKNLLVTEIIKTIEKLYGPTKNKSDDLTSIVNTNNFNRLKKIIDNNKVLYGGELDEKNLYISPTLIETPDIKSSIMKEEIFGPILPILIYDKLDDIDFIIKQNPNPLALYVFSKNKKFSDMIMNRYKFGGGIVNDTIVHLVNPNLPFGGIGNSGIGSYRGKSSFELFSHKKSVVKRGMWYENEVRYPPYKNKLNFVKKLLRFLK